MAATAERQRLEDTVLQPIRRPSRAHDAVLVFLGLVALWGLFAWSVQLRRGLIVTGMRDVVIWGLYITNFVFFIGISHAGTLISAILRVTQAGWRTSVTRMAEIITAVALMVGAIQIVFDLGRPDRLLNVFIYGRFQSPLIWDVFAVTTYLTGSMIYLYLPLIPDLALMRDRLAGIAPRWQQAMYRILAAGWTGTESQQRFLHRAINIMMIVIIPIAVSVHTVVSWVFAMTLRPGWNSTAFGPYFVVGAIFSGTAAIITAMVIFRRLFHLEEWITVKQFRYLGYLMLGLTLIYAYFTLGEYLTVWYKLPGEEKHLLELLFIGDRAPLFWFFVLGGLVAPALLVALPWTRTISGIVAASILVNIAMWLKRFIIVVPTLQVPLMPFDFGRYSPTWVEWSVTVGSFGWFLFLYALFARFFPLISIWEVVEEAEKRAPVLVPALASRSAGGDGGRESPVAAQVLRMSGGEE